jgi:hypothetical protein
MSEINYKQRYDDLKIKFLRSTDVAWRLGYAQALKDSQLKQMQQQLQQAQQQAQAAQQSAMMQSQGGQNGEQPEVGADGQPIQDDAQFQSQQDGTDENGAQAAQPPQANDELGAGIDELESAMGKAELSDEDRSKLQKALSAIKSFSPRVSANLDDNSKKTHTMQQKIVDNILSKWDNESKKSTNNIMDIIGTEGDR